MLMVELMISSFRGSIGAEHFYGKFVVHYSQSHENSQMELERPVDQAEADYLNKKDGNDPNYYWIKAGDMVKRFNSEADVRARAKEVFPEIFGADAMLYYNEPYPVDHPTHGLFWENGYLPLYSDHLVALNQSITEHGAASVRELMATLGDLIND